MTGATASTRDRVIELATDFRGALVLQAAVALDLFVRLDQATDVATIARERGWRADKLLVVLEALRALALVNDGPDGWGLTADARRWLLPWSPDTVDAMVRHEWAQQPLWQDLDAVLAARDALDGQQDLTQRADPERAATLLNAMRGYDRELRSRVAELDGWQRCMRVVDLAGGHGAFLAAILNRWPRLTGVVADLPTVRPVALDTFAAEGCTGRAGFVPVDLEQPASLAALDADGVLIARALHNFGPREIDAAFVALARTLPPGGLMVVVERNLGSDHDDEGENAVFAAYMAVNCRNGWVPPTPWLRASLARAGFTLHDEIAIDHHVILVARVAEAR